MQMLICYLKGLFSRQKRHNHPFDQVLIGDNLFSEGYTPTPRAVATEVEQQQSGQ
jgi:hypothetical protein